MGLQANYYPISQTTLTHFINNWHAEGFWKEVSEFRKQSTESDQKFYMGTNWHVLDFIINNSDYSITELFYSIRGHEFPAPDSSTRQEPHLPSYNNEPWQLFSYVTAAEAHVIAQWLSLIDESEFDSRFVNRKMNGIYRAPKRDDDKKEYLEFLTGLQDFYKRVANNNMAVLISIG